VAGVNELFGLTREGDDVVPEEPAVEEQFLAKGDFLGRLRLSGGIARRVAQPGGPPGRAISVVPADPPGEWDVAQFRPSQFSSGKTPFRQPPPNRNLPQLRLLPPEGRSKSVFAKAGF
jgi:hypothetical protein